MEWAREVELLSQPEFSLQTITTDLEYLQGCWTVASAFALLTIKTGLESLQVCWILLSS